MVTPPTLSLPAGMRDLLPAEAHARRSLGRVVHERMALFGYELVVPPAFELAEVLERGLGALDPADVLRFVEPESGEVAALRPDMTPQVARMVATRLATSPPPFRLAYEGTVLRRRQQRARKHRQIPQAGLELVGVAGPDGDVEVLTVAADVVRAAGVRTFAIDLAHAEIVQSLLRPYPAALADELRDALSMKDERRVAALAWHSSASPETARALSELPALHGGADVLARARPLLAPTPARAPLAALDALVGAATAAGLGAELHVDVGEARGFAYYTGMMFHVLADGPGEALGGGGRYDELLARFGAPMPAAGFALDLDHLAWAARVSGAAEPRATRVAVAGWPALLVALRAVGVPAAAAPESNAEAWAKASRYTGLASPSGFVRFGAGALQPLPGDATSAAASIQRLVGEPQ